MEVGWGRGRPGSPAVSSPAEVSLELALAAALCGLELRGTEAALTETQCPERGRRVLLPPGGSDLLGGLCWALDAARSEETQGKKRLKGRDQVVDVTVGCRKEKKLQAGPDQGAQPSRTEGEHLLPRTALAGRTRL